MMHLLVFFSRQELQSDHHSEFEPASGGGLHQVHESHRGRAKGAKEQNT